jgi:hypothetical protein
MVAGGLKMFVCHDMRIEMPERIDIALWHNRQGQWEGVLQGHSGPIPNALIQLNANWSRLQFPVPLRKDIRK